MKVLINAILAKRIGGGSYQITQNYIRQTIHRKDISWAYIISEDLYADMKDFFDDCDAPVYVFRNQPDVAHYYSTQKRVYKIECEFEPDIVYSIVAPSYYRFKRGKEVMRFTHPWITHPNQYLKKILGPMGGLKLAIYNAPRIYFMKKCKYFITQSETAKKGICRITGTRKDFVQVIPNTLPAYFLDITPTPNLNIEGYHIASVAAPQKGKNLLLIPDFIHQLITRHNLNNVWVYTTIPTTNIIWQKLEKRAKELGVSNHIRNMGYVKQADLVSLYNRCNFIFFPSIMEVFSASLLEAMYFQLPVLASDLEFNRDVCKDCGTYFEPMNAIDAADKFINLIQSKEQQESIKAKGKEYINEYLNYQQHFQDSITFFKSVLSHEE